jgi:myo-inositol-1(or 4)-monophosphatase
LTGSEIAADLALIRDAARAAGAQALRLREAGLTTRYKADRTPVTNADLALDADLKTQLMGARPDYGWLSEETADNADRLTRGRVFVVDPIDGTRAFVKAKPWWSVCVAVVEAGRPVAGVVFAPQLEEMFEAVAGGGARLNGAPIRAQDREAIEGCAMLADPALFAHSDWPAPWPPMRVESRNSIAYRLCSVARGEFDATLALSSKAEWDVAASALIAIEAGCVVTDDLGRAFAYNQVNPSSRGLVCAGATLHQLILERLAAIAQPD